MMNSPNETNTLEKITLLTKLIAPPKDIDMTWFDYKAGNFCAKKSKVQGRGYRLVGALNAKPEQNKGVLISMELQAPPPDFTFNQCVHKERSDFPLWYLVKFYKGSSVNDESLLAWDFVERDYATGDDLRFVTCEYKCPPGSHLPPSDKRVGLRFETCKFNAFSGHYNDSSQELLECLGWMSVFERDASEALGRLLHVLS